MFKDVENALKRDKVVVTDVFNLYYPYVVSPKNDTWNFIVDPENELDMAIAKRYFKHINTFDMPNLMSVYYNPAIVTNNVYIVLNVVETSHSSQHEALYNYPLMPLYVMDPAAAYSKTYEPINFKMVLKQGPLDCFIKNNLMLSDEKQFKYLIQMLIKHTCCISQELYDTVFPYITRYGMYRFLAVHHYSKSELDFHLTQPSYLSKRGLDLRRWVS